MRDRQPGFDPDVFVKMRRHRAQAGLAVSTSGVSDAAAVGRPEKKRKATRAERRRVQRRKQKAAKRR